MLPVCDLLFIKRKCGQCAVLSFLVETTVSLLRNKDTIRFIEAMNREQHVACHFQE